MASVGCAFLAGWSFRTVNISSLSSYTADVSKLTAAIPPAPMANNNNNTSSSPLNTTLPSFTELLIQSGSDTYHRHRYDKYYEKWLPKFRNKPNLKFLEIGARDGKSLELWSNYFSQPQLILGLAYENNSGPRTHTQGVENRTLKLNAVDVYFGDQSKRETMDHLKKLGPWDVIIDDGSHVPQHMMFGLFSLWKSIEPGGMYVIEDLETNYWPSGDKVYGYPLQGVGIGASPEHSAIPKLQQLQEVLVRHAIGATELSIMPGDDEICSVEWGMNLVAIHKCTDREKTSFPPYQKKKYNEENMKTWMEEAKRTNPAAV